MIDAATIAEVLAHMNEGDSLRKACRQAGISHSSWLERCEKDAVLADQYARARATGRAIRFDALRELADATPERDDKGRIDPAWVAWKRLHVDTEKWALSKEEPKKYGDKLELSGDAESPLQVVVKQLTPKKD